MKEKIKKSTNRKTNRRSADTSPAKRRRRASYWLNVLPHDLWLRVRRRETILHALQRADIDLEGDCGGIGKCGKCKVKILTSMDYPTESETLELLNENEIKEGIRLACITSIQKDLAVYVGEATSRHEYFQILKIGETPQILLYPLIEKQLVGLSLVDQSEGISDLTSIRQALGPVYKDLEASLHCLQRLPGMLKKGETYGTAVLHEKYLLDIQERKDAGHCYGLVFDLGTSTLVGKLINLLDGHQVAAISRLNRQMKFGSDVISRIQHVKEDKEGLSQMHEFLLRDMNVIVRRLLEVTELSPADIFVTVAAGNTTMQHFLLKLDPSGIAEAPFSPVLNDGIIVKARDAGLGLHPEGLLYVMPTKSGYIGGDLVSVILASEVAEQDNEIVLGLDLGTNGEIFLGNQRRLMTCSAAAGPALEGAKISHGAIAQAGAIEGARFTDGELSYKEIGNVKPTGICGSGLVDLVYVLLQCGIIDQEGLIQPPAPGGGYSLNHRVIEHGGVYNFLIASEEESNHGREIYLTQKDVRELQLAKAAIAAGIRTLMKEMDIRLEDISRVYLAGALGNYVNPYAAMGVGLLPMIDPRIIKSLGNAASTGGSMVLLSRGYWNRANELVEFIEHIELSCRRDFTESFIANMDFPEDNPWDRRKTDLEAQSQYGAVSGL